MYNLTMQKPIFVVLASGEGKRFKPFVTDKLIFPFLGKPLLAYVLETIAQAGGEEVVVVANNVVHTWLQTYNLPGLDIQSIANNEPTGMATALIKAKEVIGSRSTVVLNGDDLVHPDLLKEIMSQAADTYALVTGKQMEHYFPGGYLNVEGNRVVSVIEKPGEGNQPSNLVRLVADYFSEPQTFISYLEEIQSENDDVYEQALAKLMTDHTVGFVPYDKYWQALKYSHHVLDMTDLMLEEFLTPTIVEPVHIGKNVTIEGNVFIGEGAKIFEGAVIRGPVYIGKNAVIGNHTLVRHAIIEEGAVVGFGSEVSRSYIGPNCWLHHNYIGDSVLEADVNPSYGTTTANWRFDNQPVHITHGDKKINTNREKFGALIAKGAFLGINCSIMPGITIGAHARVFPGSVIYAPVEAGGLIKP